MYEKQTEDVKKRKFFLILAFVLFGVFLCFLVCYLLGFFDFSSDKGFFGLGQKEDAKISREAEGEIFLTLSPLGTDKPNIYKLDVETMELEEYFKDSPYRNYMANFSPDGKKMAFVRVYEDDRSQLVVLDEKTEEVSEIGPRNDGFIRNPRFSRDNQQIVYWVFEGTDSFFGKDPEDHSIYITGFDGFREKVANGVFPVFSPDGKYLLFMKNDGLYTFDLNRETENLALDIRFTEEFKEWVVENNPGLSDWLTLRFNISPENNLLVATDTANSFIHILKINSWSTFSYERLVNTYFYARPNWPVFSQSGDYFAIQEFLPQTETSEEFSNLPYLGIFNSTTLERETDFSLKDYELNNIWVTDWVIR